MKKIYIQPVTTVAIIKTVGMIATSTVDMYGKNATEAAMGKERHEEDFGDSHTGWTDGLW